MYEADNVETVKPLARENNDQYIVIDDGNRNSEMYNLNERICKDPFPLLYSDEDGNTHIYGVDKRLNESE